MSKPVIVGCAFLALVCALPAFAAEKRNVLMDSYSRGVVRQALTLDHSWIKYPAYRDRAGWERIPAEIRKATISRGEKFLGHPWPVIKATDYLEFTRKGNRAVVDNTLKELSGAFRSLLAAELMEGTGRFTDDIINGVFHYCQVTYWGSSAHFYLYGHAGDYGKPTTVVPDQIDPIIDLGVGDVAADLAWTWYFLHEEFDRVSPVVARRLKDEIRRKVLEPYYRRNDFWWLYGRDGRGRVNNWTPWCNYNVLVCILLLEDDPAKKEYGIYKSMGSVDIFINGYPPDGSCSEGPGYWSPAVGRMFGYLDLLSDCTKGKIDIFGNEKLREMGRTSIAPTSAVAAITSISPMPRCGFATIRDGSPASGGVSRIR